MVGVFDVVVLELSCSKNRHRQKQYIFFCEIHAVKITTTDTQKQNVPYYLHRLLGLRRLAFGPLHLRLRHGRLILLFLGQAKKKTSTTTTAE